MEATSKLISEFEAKMKVAEIDNIQKIMYKLGGELIKLDAIVSKECLEKFDKLSIEKYDKMEMMFKLLNDLDNVYAELKSMQGDEPLKPSVSPRLRLSLCGDDEKN